MSGGLCVGERALLTVAVLMAALSVLVLVGQVLQTGELTPASFSPSAAFFIARFGICGVIPRKKPTSLSLSASGVGGLGHV